MGKADAYFTLHFWGDNDNITEVDENKLKKRS